MFKLRGREQRFVSQRYQIIEIDIIDYIGSG
jgi:hypothetical protein